MRLLPVLLLVPLLLDGLSLSVLQLQPLVLPLVLLLLLALLLLLLLLPLPLLKWDSLDAVQSWDNQWCGWLSINGSYGIWSFVLIGNNLGVELNTE